MKYKKLIEWLADMEHQQWIHWTSYFIRCFSLENLKKWEKQIKTPYNKLSNEEKDSDRKWANKLIDEMPFKCPIHQCGGIMKTRERKKPKEFIESEHFDGDEQSPDLVCTNCHGVYQFKGSSIK